ncbi:glycosyltransferase family 92 protein Os08g0121900-like [Phalaenopsis equestris]|uniref:glycosyltransferase family 92 protein Os08g0121900-like n=1 Tax=Phalaenopsis equestris TaxID=78828 RepID=UPI0009E218F9|nr:glycosyltransferase family 92 protein Os08g0121900-like [Phalaenopsis equestris]
MRGRRADDASMKDRRRRDGGGGGKFSRSSSFFSFPFALFLLCFALFIVAVLSTFRLFGVSFRPVLLPTWRNPPMNAISAEYPYSRRDHISYNLYSSPAGLRIDEAVSFPDSVLLFLKPQRLAAIADLHCIYFVSQFGGSHLSLPALSSSYSGSFVRCPLPPNAHAFNISLSQTSLPQLPPISPLRSDHLAYASVLDTSDNSTVIFAKGHNLRPARLSNPNSFECTFGWDFSHPKFSLSSEVLSAAQEIFRCRTPLSILQRRHHLPFVSVRFKGHGSNPLPSIARPELLPSLQMLKRPHKAHLMCVCTMLRNQARFLPEWIIYHSRIGVERWFIYDNNSDDDLEQVVQQLSAKWKLMISLHEWPWLKTQEAGFAHCALRARESCKWVGFIDVDEFLYFPSNFKLRDVLRNYSRSPSVAELRTTCHSFGPSGRKSAPPEGVMVGYSCRISPPERHKSIIKPKALNPSLINVVHHFHLKDGKKYMNMDVRVMVINHYKYQVWEVFKEKFHRRVATYVADWQDDENVGSKDRAPGLGTKAVEPSDWANRFCEVNDTGLRDWVLRTFVDPSTGHLSWE